MSRVKGLEDKGFLHFSHLAWASSKMRRSSSSLRSLSSSSSLALALLAFCFSFCFFLFSLGSL